MLYHLFNHLPLSPLQYALDPLLVAQPTIYRILNYNPPTTLDRTGEYAKACGDLLRACGGAKLDYEGLLAIVAETCTTLLRIIAVSLNDSDAVTAAEVGHKTFSAHMLIYDRSQR